MVRFFTAGVVRPSVGKESWTKDVTLGRRLLVDVAIMMWNCTAEFCASLMVTFA